MALTSPRFAGNARLQKAADNKPPLKTGEPKGKAVELVQQALVDLGYKMPVSFAKGSPDGIYGKETTQVVRQFQVDQGFPPSGWDGRAGRDTLTRLDQLFPAPVPVPPRPPLPPPIPPRRGNQGPPVPLLPDRGRLIFSERNVDVRGGLRTVAAYDLDLFRELGNPARGVLVVTAIMNFKFEDGVGTVAPNVGQPLVWNLAEKMAFRVGFKAALENTWSQRHRITTVGTATPVTDVGVIFDIQTHERMSVFSHSHWNLNTTKVDDIATTSSVDGHGGSFITNGEAILDSADLIPRDKGGPRTQRGAVHEFGHMLGYDDEYIQDGVIPGNPNFTLDRGSIMNRSERIRDRHYVFFADWLTEQSPSGTVWRVNGVRDMANSQL